MLQYWVPRERINPGVFITVFLVAIVLCNAFGIKWFGEVEFVLSSLKVLVIVGLIFLCFILALGGGPDGDRKGNRGLALGRARSEMADDDLFKVFDTGEIPARLRPI